MKEYEAICFINLVEDREWDEELSHCGNCSAQLYRAVIFCPMCGQTNTDFDPLYNGSVDPAVVCQEIHGSFVPEVDTPYCGSCGVKIRHMTLSPNHRHVLL